MGNPTERAALESERESIRLQAVAIYEMDKSAWKLLDEQVQSLTRRIVALPEDKEVIGVVEQLPLFEL